MEESSHSTKTIFLYDQDDDKRRKILNYFTKQGNYRVLCLDFLVQTKKKANEIGPMAILCCPRDEHVNILKTMTVMSRELETRRIPFYLYDADLTESQKQIYIKHGIRNFFGTNASIQDIYRGVMSGASYKKFVLKSELIQREDTLASMAKFYYLQPIAAGLADLKILLNQLSSVKLSIDWSDVCLNMSKVEEFDLEAFDMIRPFIRKVVNDGIDLAFVTDNTYIKDCFADTGAIHYPTYIDFLNKAVDVGSGSLDDDFSDSSDLPSMKAIDDIDDIDDLDSLLDSIPDV